MATENLMTVTDSIGLPIREGDTVRLRALVRMGDTRHAEQWIVGDIEHIFYKNNIPHLVVKAGMYTHVTVACKVFKER